MRGGDSNGRVYRRGAEGAETRGGGKAIYAPSRCTFSFVSFAPFVVEVLRSLRLSVRFGVRSLNMSRK
jgi:hypothetical protein